MIAYPGGHAVFLLVAITTHALVGYTLGRVLFERPLLGMAAGVFPDGDFLFPATMGWPFVHRGLTHGLLVLTLGAAVVAISDRTAGETVAVSYASHLLIDSTTPMGVPLFYPLVSEHIYLDVGIAGHAPVPTAFIWSGCLAALWYHRV